MDAAGDAQAVQPFQQLFQKLERCVVNLKLADEPFPDPVTIDGITVMNIPELMKELSRLHSTQSDLDFLAHYRAGAAIISDLASEKISGWADILVAYEDVGDISSAFQLFKKSQQYETEFAVFKAGRDWRASNQKQVQSGLELIPQEWPTIGRKLLAFEDRPTDSYVRQLKAMCGQIKNETTVIHRINRAMLNRIDNEKTRNKSLVPNYADIRSAKALPVSFKVPLESEVTERGLYFDRDIGLITKTPPDRQSYAETTQANPEIHPELEDDGAADPDKEVQSEPGSESEANPDEELELASDTDPDGELELASEANPDEELELASDAEPDEELELASEADEDLDSDRASGIESEADPNDGLPLEPEDETESDLDTGTQHEAEGETETNEPEREASPDSEFQPFISQSMTQSLRLPSSDAEWDYLMQDVMDHVKGLVLDPRLSLKNDGFADMDLFEYLNEDGELYKAALQEIDRITLLTRKQGAIHWACQFSIIQQIVQQDLLHYLVNVCIREGHPFELCIYPQPTISTDGSDDVDENFSVPVQLNWDTNLFEQSLASFVSLRAESENGCDYVLSGKTGPIQSLRKFKDDYKAYLVSCGQTLTKATLQQIDVSGMVETYPEAYKIQAAPLVKPGVLRVIPPWIPRASRGKGDRYILMPTLVATRTRATGSYFDLIFPSSNSNVSDTANDMCVESGMRLTTVMEMNKTHATTEYGPWGAADKRRRLDPWNGWIKVQGLAPISDALLGVKPWGHHTVIAQLNVLFSTDRNSALKRWELIRSHRRLLVAFALDAIARFMTETDALISGNITPEDRSATDLQDGSMGDEAVSKRARESHESPKGRKKRRTSSK